MPDQATTASISCGLLAIMPLGKIPLLAPFTAALLMVVMLALASLWQSALTKDPWQLCRSAFPVRFVQHPLYSCFAYTVSCEDAEDMLQDTRDCMTFLQNQMHAICLPNAGIYRHCMCCVQQGTSSSVPGDNLMQSLRHATVCNNYCSVLACSKTISLQHTA